MLAVKLLRLEHYASCVSNLHEEAQMIICWIRMRCQQTAREQLIWLRLGIGKPHVNGLALLANPKPVTCE